MIIEIIKSSNPKFWYATLIGQRFEAFCEKVFANEYVIKTKEALEGGENIAFYVNAEDCLISRPDFMQLRKRCKCCGVSSWVQYVPEWQIERLNLEAKLDMRQIIQLQHENLQSKFE